MMAPLVVILMGSKSDMPHAKAVAEALEQLGIKVEMRIGSGHKTPAHLLELLAQYEADRRQKFTSPLPGVPTG